MDEKSRQDLIDETERRIKFYSEKYLDITIDLTPSSASIVLERSDGRRVCRFCKRDETTTSFGQVAHAIPESLGNKVITSTFECDDCNEFFGHGIEDDLGNYTRPLRVITRIRGKKGYASYEEEGQKIKMKSGMLRIAIGSNRYKIDFEKKSLKLF